MFFSAEDDVAAVVAGCDVLLIWVTTLLMRCSHSSRNREYDVPAGRTQEVVPMKLLCPLRNA
jgi:hypothetical protein